MRWIHALRRRTTWRRRWGFYCMEFTWVEVAEIVERGRKAKVGAITFEDCRFLGPCPQFQVLPPMVFKASGWAQATVEAQRS